ncbi:MAG: hypothetical protein CMF50_04770, partial [Legionellales bacterium]|nr:hypothetical protein [Legionellales bacterium]
MVKLVLSNPQGNKKTLELKVKQSINIKPGDVAVFNDASDTPSGLIKVNDDLVLIFEDGRTIVIENFFLESASSDAATPAVEIQNQVYRPPDFDTSPQIFYSESPFLGELLSSKEGLTTAELVTDDKDELLVFSRQPISINENTINDILTINQPVQTVPVRQIFAGTDHIFLSEDQTVFFNIFSNDYSPYGGLTVVNVDDNALDGILLTQPNGNFTYTPDPIDQSLAHGEIKLQQINYTASDSQGNLLYGTVRFTISGENDQPSSTDDTAVTSEDVSIIISPLSNDSDPDASDTLEIISINSLGLVGDVVLNPDSTVTYNSNGQFDYLESSETAIESFTYIAQDSSGESTSSTIFITIIGSEDPLIATDDTATTDEDSPVSISVLNNDQDADDGFSLTSVSPPPLGSVSINGTTIDYDPSGVFDALDVGETVIETFTYTITNDDGTTAVATVTMTVTGVEDPLVAANDTATTNEDTLVTIPVLANDQDLDDGFSLSGVTAPALGSVSINGNSIDYDPSGAFDFLDVGDTAIETFTYTVTNDDGTTNIATVSVTVTGVEDPLI